MNKPMDTTVMIVQMLADKRWRVMLAYEDGNEYISENSWPTEEGATQAAYEWVTDNHIPSAVN